MIKRRVTNALKYVILTTVSIMSAFPILWMIIAATNKSVDITKGTLIPGTYLVENLKNLNASSLDYFGAFKNSLIIAVVTTSLAMVVASAAGYGFEVYKSKARTRVFNIILLAMMIPFAALIVPLFRTFSKFTKIPVLNLISINTFGSAIIVFVATAFLVFFFKQNTQSFPRDLIESARIDGLGELQVFLRIYMPTMKSTYAAAVIVTFMKSWNEYLWPLVTLQSPEKKTLPVVMSAMGSSYTPDYGMMMLAVFIATIPTAVLFFFMQKHFVAGMTGALKG